MYAATGQVRQERIDGRTGPCIKLHQGISNSRSVNRTNSTSSHAPNKLNQRNMTFSVKGRHLHPEVVYIQIAASTTNPQTNACGQPSTRSLFKVGSSGHTPG